jgi:dynein heavy chain 2
MSSKVDSEIQAFNVELEKFGSRWNQLKPRDDIATSGDNEATAVALASLKERRAEFNELMSTASRLRFG